MKQFTELKESQAVTSFLAKPSFVLGAAILTAGCLLLAVDGLKVFYK